MKTKRDYFRMGWSGLSEFGKNILQFLMGVGDFQNSKSMWFNYFTINYATKGKLPYDGD